MLLGMYGLVVLHEEDPEFTYVEYPEEMTETQPLASHFGRDLGLGFQVEQSDTDTMDVDQTLPIVAEIEPSLATATEIDQISPSLVTVAEIEPSLVTATETEPGREIKTSTSVTGDWMDSLFNFVLPVSSFDAAGQVFGTNMTTGRDLIKAPLCGSHFFPIKWGIALLVFKCYSNLQFQSCQLKAYRVGDASVAGLKRDDMTVLVHGQGPMEKPTFIEQCTFARISSEEYHITAKVNYRQIPCNGESGWYVFVYEASVDGDAHVLKSHPVLFTNDQSIERKKQAVAARKLPARHVYGKCGKKRNRSPSPVDVPLRRSVRLHF